MSNQMVFWVALWGGTVFGPIIGGITLSAISELVRFYSAWHKACTYSYTGLIVVIMIMFKPHNN